MRRALLIGGTGFVGGHLRRRLEDRFQVTVSGRDADVRDIDQVRRLVAATTPDSVVCLASITTVRESFADPLNTYRTGFLGTLNILTALREAGFRGRMLYASSSEVYGHPTAEELPLTEQSALRPMSPYAVSKLASEALCGQWHRSEGFDIVTVRPFTHIGPGQSDRFAIARFARQVAEIMLGMREPVVRVGNLEATRDFCDVRDVAAAYDAVLEHGASGEVYNVCSGAERSTASLLRELIALSGLEIRVEQDAALLRGAEQARLRGSCEKLRTKTGWEPRMSLTQTLNDTLLDWRARLQQPRAPCT
jgi:GDP-4-dehydro-6-deoxy-D-mannose reductase